MKFNSIKLLSLGLAATFMVACGGLKTRAISKNKALYNARKVVLFNYVKPSDKVEKAITDFQAIIDTDTLIDNSLLSLFYFVKAKHALSMGASQESYQKFIQSAQRVVEIENRTEYLALNVATQYYDFFDTKEERNDAVKSATHKEPMDRAVSKEYSTLISNDMNQVANDYVQLGFKEYQAKKYPIAAEIFADVAALQASPGFTGNKIQGLLYNAANTNYTAKLYDKAAAQFKQLIKEGYTGIETRYEATGVKDKQVYNFGNATELKTALKTGKYVNDTTYQTEDQTATLYTMLGNIYLMNKKYKKALEVINQGREKLPTNQDLLALQGNAYLKLDDMDSFIKNMEEAIQNDPANPQLYFNIAVVNQQMADKYKDKEKEEFLARAKEHYIKATEVDAEYSDAYLNLSVLVLNKEKAINDKINAIKGYSRSDRRKIEKYTKEKKVVYKDALQYLEKAYKLDPKNVDILKTLKGIYYQLDRTKDYKKINKELKALK